ncbi:hypothetical protein [Porphyromonas gingivalis]|uniref:hypothetical protein n=1 Tax=Porphyromonas gingivalis TaxID=837 RepID=UPI003BA917DF
MTGNSTCAPPTIALLPVYAPCAPRCTVLIHIASIRADTTSGSNNPSGYHRYTVAEYQLGETRSNEAAKPI